MSIEIIEPVCAAVSRNTERSPTPLPTLLQRRLSGNLQYRGAQPCPKPPTSLRIPIWLVVTFVCVFSSGHCGNTPLTRPFPLLGISPPETFAAVHRATETKT